MRKFLYSILTIFISLNFTHAQTDIVAELGQIKGLTFKEVIPSPSPAYRVFDMEFDQPEDHNDPNSPKFQQRLVLWHKDDTRPMVLQTSGYAIFSYGLASIATEFDANQIQVEHRFFANSVPADKNWAFDNIEESAGDFHDVTVAFKSIYKAKWVNTGRSKGGMTSVYQRRFYPNDLDATIAHVAPHSFSLTDQRYADFVDNKVGGDANAQCRADLVTDQKILLQNKSQIIGRLQGTYNQLSSKEIALEHSIIELPWSYWQYSGPGADCANVPKANAPIADHINFLMASNDPNGYNDAALADFVPYYFQAATQLGNPATNLQPIASLLNFADTFKIGSYIPAGVPAVYDNAKAMLDVSDWLKNESTHMIFVYGEWDPWGAGAYTEIRAEGDNYRFFVPKTNHSAQVTDLQGADRDLAYGKIRTWLNISDEGAPVVARRNIRNAHQIKVESLEYKEFLKIGPRKIL